jgi:hypothetical protein
MPAPARAFASLAPPSEGAACTEFRADRPVGCIGLGGALLMEPLQHLFRLPEMSVLMPGQDCEASVHVVLHPCVKGRHDL